MNAYLQSRRLCRDFINPRRNVWEMRQHLERISARVNKISTKSETLVVSILFSTFQIGLYISLIRWFHYDADFSDHNIFTMHSSYLRNFILSSQWHTTPKVENKKLTTQASTFLQFLWFTRRNFIVCLRTLQTFLLVIIRTVQRSRHGS